MASVDSNSSSFDGTPDFSITHTPDLARKPTKDEMELAMLNGLPTGKHPFVPSGPVSREDFEAHVEKFDANRQLLFQEEFDVSIYMYM